jgi:hypothetical protein
MRNRVWLVVVLGVAVASPLVVSAFAAEDDRPPAGTKPDSPKVPSPADMAAMMEKAKTFTQPGPHHKELARFVGKWNMEMRFFMGDKASPPTKGTSETRWLMDGRWLITETRGQMMGRPYQAAMLMGYDNFKQSFVTAAVSSVDTAMTHSEGDMDPGGKVLITYGLLDEYLTGEVGKMVKYVWRFVSDDKVVWEVHDLPIGENNTKVVEFTFTRAE